jgi:hypothetical protein
MPDKRGWTTFELELAATTRKVPLDDIVAETSKIDESAAKVYQTRNEVNTITLEKMKTWIKEAREAREAIKTNNQKEIAAILSKKNILDALMEGYETHLTNIKNKDQLKFIEKKKTEIEELASALRAKQGEVAGAVKKRKSTRRRRSRRRHRKSTRRRRSRRHRKY